MSPFAGGEPVITKSIHHDNFISEFETNLDCTDIIEYYKFISENGLTIKRHSEKGAADSQIFMHELPVEYFHDNLSRSIFRRWNYLTDQALREYVLKYDILVGRRFQHTMAKIQKTEPGQGYHAWHYESTPSAPYRKLATMIYLNDGFEGGETEFLYQSRRVKPKQGTMVICPSSFTHTHRGNPPLTGDKYMINGWIEYSN